MKNLYVSSGVFTIDAISILGGLMVGITVGIGSESMWSGILISLIMPITLLSHHFYLLKTLKN